MEQPEPDLKSQHNKNSHVGVAFMRTTAIFSKAASSCLPHGKD